MIRLEVTRNATNIYEQIYNQLCIRKLMHKIKESFKLEKTLEVTYYNLSLLKMRKLKSRNK
jgi:hypothetical protein